MPNEREGNIKKIHTHTHTHLHTLALIFIYIQKYPSVSKQIGSFSFHRAEAEWNFVSLQTFEESDISLSLHVNIVFIIIITTTIIIRLYYKAPTFFVTIKYVQRNQARVQGRGWCLNYYPYPNSFSKVGLYVLRFYKINFVLIRVRTSFVENIQEFSALNRLLKTETTS